MPVRGSKISSPEMEETKASIEESRRMLSEFFLKSLNVILGARIPAKYLHHQSSSSSSSANGSFNLVLVNSPMRNKCHLSVVEPIVVDVLLLHHGSGPCPGQDRAFQWNPLQQTAQRQSLLERWVVHCVPWTSCLKIKSPEAGKSKSKSKDLAAAGKPPLSRRPDEKKKKGQNPWRRVVKTLTVMLRSLYSLTRLLPAYRIFQQLNSSSAGRCSPGCCHFDLSYRVRSTYEGGGTENSLCKFDLMPVETEFGRMCISVRYADTASVEKAIQRTSSIFSVIIPDYVRGDGAGGSSGNPHFAVSDKRISAATRTMSSNIPAAKAAAATVKRSNSSPLDQTELDKQPELICPFACDDELKISRDAATGALIAALLSSTPIERPPHQNAGSKTLRHALRELQSYSDIARNKAVNT